MFSRNAGFITEEEQSKIAAAKVAIAGVGGDGGLVAEGLARLGFTNFVLADPEVFELENLNRQNGSSTMTIGQNKAKVIAGIISAINPDAQVVTYESGVFPHNVDEFLDGADIVVDETEFTLHELAVMLARGARSRGVPVVTGFNVGFGCLMTSFRPDGQTIEEYLGLPVEASLEEIASLTVPLEKWVPRLPDYIPDDIVAEVALGQRPAPSVFPGVAVAASCVVTEVFNQVVGREPFLSAPEVLWIDVMQRSCEVFKT